MTSIFDCVNYDERKKLKELSRKIHSVDTKLTYLKNRLNNNDKLDLIKAQIQEKELERLQLKQLKKDIIINNIKDKTKQIVALTISGMET